MRAIAGPAAAAGLALILYLATLAPGLYWGDCADLQLSAAAPELGVGARSYPAWVLASAGLMRIGGLEPAHAANLLSAIFGALSVGVCFFTVRVMTRSLYAAAFASLSLMVSHLAWSSSTAAEVYSLNILAIFAVLLLARPAARGSARAAFFLSLLAGLAFLHHRILPLAAAVVWLSLVPRWRRDAVLKRQVTISAAGAFLGLIPFVLLYLALGGASAGSVQGLLHGAFRPSLPSGFGQTAGLVAYIVRFFAYNLAGPQLILLPLGILALWRQRPHEAPAITALALVGLSLPFFFPRIGDRYVMLVPAVCAACVAAGYGAAAIIRRPGHPVGRALLLLLAVALPVAAYLTAARTDLLLKAGLFEGAHERHLRAFLWPGKEGNRDAERFGKSVLSALPEEPLLLTEWGEGQVIRYLQEVDGLRPDVRLGSDRLLRRPDRLRAELADRRVFFAPHPLLRVRDEPAEEFHFEPVIPGSLYEVRPGAPTHR